MFIWIAWCSVYLSAVVFCIRLKPSQDHNCSTEKMENVTIDIKMALSKGIRGADPIHTASQEMCIDLCCSGGKITGTKKCNYAVFHSRRKGNYPNCYLFYYPTEETCPTRPVIGLLTYRITHGAKNPVSPSVKVSTVNGSFISPPATVIGPSNPTGLLNEFPPLPTSTALNRPEIVRYSDKHLNQTDGRSEHLQDGRMFNSSAVRETSSSLSKSIIKTIQHINTTLQTTTKLPALITDIQTDSIRGTIPQVPFSKSITFGPTTVYHRNTPLVVGNSRRRPIISLPSNNTRSNTSDGSPLVSRMPIEISSASLPGSHTNNSQLGLEDNVLDGVSNRKQMVWFIDTSILIAALLLGVIFLVLVTVLVGRKMLESLQQRRYTRLDYLINDMYVNM